jgi:hypothetical protein
LVEVGGQCFGGGETEAGEVAGKLSDRSSSLTSAGLLDQFGVAGEIDDDVVAFGPRSGAESRRAAAVEQVDRSASRLMR